MTMVMMPGGFPHGHNAAMRYFALGVFELDGGVVNLEFVMQFVFYIS